MSPAAAAARGDGTRENPWGVCGVAAGLALIVLAFLFISQFRGGPIDGSERVARLFRGGAPAFGLELADASRLPTGEVVLRLERDAGEDGEPRLPEELVFIEYQSPAAVTVLFSGVPGTAGEALAAWEEDPTQTFHTTLDNGEIAWREWLASYLVERSFRDDGAWRDSARVNLSRGRRYLALFAQWPPDVAATREGLTPILETIVLEEPAAAK